jgi:hypothetical protein
VACTINDYMFETALLSLAIACLISTWWHSSLIKILEMRHMNTYQILGAPSLQTTESDRHSIATTLFLISPQHKTLNDKQVTKHVWTLRCCIAIDVGAIGLLCYALTSSDSTVLKLLTFSCWQR